MHQCEEYCIMQWNCHGFEGDWNYYHNTFSTFKEAMYSTVSLIRGSSAICGALQLLVYAGDRLAHHQGLCSIFISSGAKIDCLYLVKHKICMLLGSDLPIVRKLLWICCVRGCRNFEWNDKKPKPKTLALFWCVLDS